MLANPPELGAKTGFAFGSRVSQDAPYLSALTHSEGSCSDSFRRLSKPSRCAILARGIGGQGHVTAGMCGIEGCGTRAVGGNLGRPKPAAQTHRAGEDCPRLR